MSSKETPNDQIQSRIQLVDNVFEIERFNLDNYTKKSLLIIMKHGMVPIELTSAYVIFMSFDSFVGLGIKISHYIQLTIMIARKYL
jgi:hypothetical protein